MDARLAAAGPAEAGAQAAGERDDGVARLGGHDAGQAPAFVRRRAPARRPSPCPPARRARPVAGPRRSAPRGRSTSIRSVPGATGNTAVGRAGRGPHDREPAEVGVHDDPDRPRVAEGRDAADGEARQLPAPRSRSRAGTSGSPVTAARRARSTRLGPETRHRIGSSAPASAGRHEDQRLDDLAELRVDRRRRRPRRCGSTRRTRGRRGSRPCGRRRRRLAGSARDREVRARRESTDCRRSAPARPVGSRS